MASTYSNLKLQLMTTGENLATWGDTTNINLGTAIEEAIVGSADVTFASADVTLTLTNTNSSQTARNMRLRLIGTTGGARSLIVPAIEKIYAVKNECADAITVKNATGTGINVPASSTMWVYNDGTNVVDVVTAVSSLGIGMTPTNPLDINGNANGPKFGSITNPSNGAFAYCGWNAGNGAYNAQLVQMGTNYPTSGIHGANRGGLITSSDMFFNSGGNVLWGTNGSTTEKMRLDASGKLGLGMTPANVVDITNTGTAETVIKALNSNGGASANVRLLLDNGTKITNVYQLSQGYTSNGVYQAGYGGVSTASGMFLASGGQIGFATGGTATQKMSLDNGGNLAASGNIIAGAALGGAACTISGDFTGDKLSLGGRVLSGETLGVIGNVYASGSVIAGGLNTSGGISVGTALTTGGNLTVNGTASVHTSIGGWTGNSNFSVLSVNPGAHCIDADIDNSTGNCFMGRMKSTGGQFAGWIYNTGQVGSITTNSVSTSYNTSSDARLKTNIQDADLAEAWAVLNGLRVRSWDWLGTEHHEDFGFVAQEEVLVAPFAVRVGDDNPEEIETQWGRDDSKLVPALVKVIQDMAARITALEAAQ